MAVINEYLSRRWGLSELLEELLRLTKEYNKITHRYLLIYSSDFSKIRRGIDDVALQQDDFYIIQDMLRESPERDIDVYLETPGGSGEAAEEIARFLHRKFSSVRFIIAGEAKSAGTILAMSGDDIMMTDTGSLGPIDAQVRIGRQMVSAYDYKAWVEDKRIEAEKTGKLNPFDAVMVAQISPGEIYGVYNSLDYAIDLVKEWLFEYKYKNWEKTDSGKTVTEEYKRARAKEAAEFLCDHITWRSHGRSLKIDDLKEYIKIDRIDDNPALSNVVYRINTILRLIFGESNIYKLFRTEDTYLAKNALAGATPVHLPAPGAPSESKKIGTVDVNITCPKCGKHHKIQGYVNASSADIARQKLKVCPNIKDGDIFVCDNCGFSLDLKTIKNQYELRNRRKLIFK